MDKFTRYVLIGIIVVVLSFQFFNIVLSNNVLSGNLYTDYNVTKRAIRLGTTAKEEVSYPIVITFQDLIMFLIAGTLCLLLYLDKKGERGYRERYEYRTLLATITASFISLIVLYVLFILQYTYRFEFLSIGFNEWSIYYLIHFLFMVFLAANLILTYFIAIRHEKEQKDLKKILDKIAKFFRTPKRIFLALTVCLVMTGLLIGVMDAYYTHGGFFESFPYLVKPHFYALTMFALLFFICFSIVLVYLFGRSDGLRFRLFSSFIAVFTFLVYPSGLWFFSWHALTKTLWPVPQHPLPYRIYPFAIYWESWMDYWIMWLSLIGFAVMAYFLYRRIKDKKVGKK